MQLQVGRKYQAIDGSVFYCKYNQNEMGFSYNPRPFGGTREDVEGFKCSSFYTENGIYNLDKIGGPKDIILEII